MHLPDSLQRHGDDISSLPVPDAKFQEAKSNYLGKLTVTLEIMTTKIKAMKDNKSRSGSFEWKEANII